jgi:selenide,water dikinase
VLVGINTGDDAAVYRISDDLALIQTIDFFTPIVDDPFSYGEIAVANSLSDVYAMGGKPLFALNVIGFHLKEMSPEVLGQILKGGAAKAAEAGIQIIGGHSVDDKEPKYGLSVTGTINPADVKKNSTAQVGDVLILTKPLGIGIITTGIKRGLVSDEAIARATEVMSKLNRDAADAMVAAGANACTDITGYGLLGHLGEMTQGSGVGARIHARAVPVLQAARDMIDADLGIAPGGTKNNLRFVSSFVNFDPAITEAEQLILADAQTSGGLLIAIPATRADELEQALKDAGSVIVARIGVMEAEDDTGRIDVVP